MTTRKRRRISISDIARLSGVSVSTISRVLNGRADVSEKTRNRVQSLIAEYDYEPHRHAQRLASGRSNTVALLFPLTSTGTDEVLLDFILGANVVVDRHRFFLDIQTQPITETRLLSMYSSGHVDGVIVMQVSLNDWRVQALLSRDLPFIAIGRTSDTTGYSYVDIDFEAGMRKVISYLIELGHTRIGYMSPSESLRDANFGPAVREMRGYLSALQQYKIAICRCDSDFTYKNSFQATTELLRDDPDLSAIVSGSGDGISGVYDAIRKHGLRVPEDVSVISTSATERIALSVSPNLTSINIPSMEMASQATEILINMLNMHDGKHHEVLVEPHLVLRESSTTAPIFKCRGPNHNRS